MWGLALDAQNDNSVRIYRTEPTFWLLAHSFKPSTCADCVLVLITSPQTNEHSQQQLSHKNQACCSGIKFNTSCSKMRAINLTKSGLCDSLDYISTWSSRQVVFIIIRLTVTCSQFVCIQKLDQGYLETFYYLSVTAVIASLETG